MESLNREYTFGREETVDELINEMRIFDAILKCDLPSVVNHLNSLESAKVDLTSDPGINIPHDRDGWNPLHYCVYAGCIAKPRKGSDGGDDGGDGDGVDGGEGDDGGECGEVGGGGGDSDNSDGDKSHLFLACLDILKLLLDKVDVNSANIGGVTALHIAVWYNNHDIIKILLSKSADVNLEADDVYKARWGQARNLQGTTLIPRDSELYRNDSFCIGCGVTPLYLAARIGDQRIMKLLIAAGADPDTSKNFGEHIGITALHAASARGNIQAVKVLIQAGCDVDKQASDGGTALHCAAEFGNVGVARLLLAPRLYGKVGENSVNVGKACVEATGITPLHLATSANNIDVMKLLIQCGADINACASDGFSPIHLAAQNGLLAPAELLLKMGCDHSAKANIDGCSDLSPLHLAVRADCYQLIALFINLGADVHETAKVADVSNVSMLHLAAVVGHVGVLKTLIQLDCDIDAVTSTGNTPIYLSIKERHVESATVLLEAGCKVKNMGLVRLAVLCRQELLVRKLVNAGCDVNDLSEVIEDGCTVVKCSLAVAVEKNDLFMTSLLLELGADTSIRLKDGWTVMHLSAFKGQTEILEVMIKDGGGDFDIEVKESTENMASQRNDFLMTPIDFAILGGHDSTVEFLLEIGADINHIQKHSGDSSLHLACESGEVEIVRLLLEKGCKVDRCRHVIHDITKVDTGDHRTSLHIAAEKGFGDIVKLLLEYNADLNSCCHGYSATSRRHVDLCHDLTPLHLACHQGHLDVVEILLKCETPPKLDKASIPDLMTPIHLATIADYHDIVTLLISAGASIHRINARGRSCLHYSARVRQGCVDRCPLGTSIVEELLTAGALVDVVDNSGFTPLHQASKYGVFHALRALWRAGADVHACANFPASDKPISERARDFEKATPLHLAAAFSLDNTEENEMNQCRSEMIRFLLSKGAKVNVKDAKNRTPLHNAAWVGNIEATRALLAAKADPQLQATMPLRDSPGYDCESCAVSAEGICYEDAAGPGGVVNNNRGGAAKANGGGVAKGNPCDSVSKLTALHLASYRGHSSLLKFLVTAGCPVNSLDGRRRSSLHLASHFDRPTCVRHLIELGATINIQDDQALTPVEYTILNDSGECFEVLLEAMEARCLDLGGTPPTSENYTSRYAANDDPPLDDVRLALKRQTTAVLETLAHKCVRHKAKRCLRVLASKEYDMETTCTMDDVQLTTPLHLACRLDHSSCVRELLRAGVTLNSKDGKGRLALEVAVVHDSREAVRLLRKHAKKMAATSVVPGKSSFQ